MPRTKPDALAELRKADNAIRMFNHATLDTRGLPHPPAVSDAAQTLIQLLDKLPQALEQMTVAIGRHDLQELIYTDNGADPHQAATEATEHLGTTIAHLEGASRSLHKASSILWTFGTAERRR